MRLLIDEQSVPGAIIDYSNWLAEQFNLESKIIRKREKDLYKLTSTDFNKELKKLTSYNSLKDILEIMDSNDILISDDLELVSHSIPRLASVIGSDGLVYSPERLERLTIQEHLNKIQGKSNVRKLIKKRDKELDEQFKQTLYEFLENVQ